MVEEIKSLLGKYLTITPPQSAVRKALAKSIKDETGIEIDMKDMNVVRGVAHIKTSATAKSDIFIKKRSILKNVSVALGGKKELKDIR